MKRTILIVLTLSTIALRAETTAVDSTERLDTATQSPLRQLADSVSLGAEGRSAERASIPTAVAKENDTITFWLAPHWGLDFGWSLGSSPLFDIWAKSVSSNLRDLGLSDRYAYTDTSGLPDTVRVRFDSKEKPSSYNMEFPVGLHYTALVRGRHSLAAGVYGSFQRKQAVYVIRADSIPGRLTVDQSLGIYVAGISLDYSVALPDTYFKVDNTVRSLIRVGVGVLPLAYIRAEDKSGFDHETDSTFASSVSTAERNSTRDAFGFGLSWSFGVSALKLSGQLSGLEAGLMYQGRFFYFDGFSENDLQGIADAGKQSSLHAFTHRFTIVLQLLRGRRPVQQPNTDTPPTAEGVHGVSSD